MILTEKKAPDGYTFVYTNLFEVRLPDGLSDEDIRKVGTALFALPFIELVEPISSCNTTTYVEMQNAVFGGFQIRTKDIQTVTEAHKWEKAMAQIFNVNRAWAVTTTMETEKLPLTLRNRARADERWGYWITPEREEVERRKFTSYNQRKENE